MHDPEQHYISLVKAGQQFGGISAEALKKRIKRHNAKPNAKQVRLIPGFIRLEDFRRWIEELETKERD